MYELKCYKIKFDWNVIKTNKIIETELNWFKKKFHKNFNCFKLSLNLYQHLDFALREQRYQHVHLLQQDVMVYNEIK